MRAITIINYKHNHSQHQCTTYQLDENPTFKKFYNTMLRRTHKNMQINLQGNPQNCETNWMSVQDVLTKFNISPLLLSKALTIARINYKVEIKCTKYADFNPSNVYLESNACEILNCIFNTEGKFIAINQISKILNINYNTIKSILRSTPKQITTELSSMHLSRQGRAYYAYDKKILEHISQQLDNVKPQEGYIQHTRLSNQIGVTEDTLLKVRKKVFEIISSKQSSILYKK